MGLESESNDVTVIATRTGQSHILDESGDVHSFEMDTRKYQSNFNLKQCEQWPIIQRDRGEADTVHRKAAQGGHRE